MDYREIIESNDSVIIKGVKNFNIKQILECGQCFRWQRVTDTDYIVVSNRRVIEIIQSVLVLHIIKHKMSQVM